MLRKWPAPGTQERAAAETRWRKRGKQRPACRCRSSPKRISKDCSPGVLRLNISRVENLYHDGSSRPYVDYCHGASGQPSSHQCQPADMIIKPRAALLASRIPLSGWHGIAIRLLAQGLSPMPLIGGRVIRSRQVNMPLPHLVAKCEGCPLGELHEARLFVNLSESAALRGSTARSVVVQGAFNSLAAR